MTDLLSGKKHIHFIGIGGSGMFPIAQILHSRGFYITGSDNNPSDTLELVKGLSIPVTLGQSAENIEGADLIVYTAAIMEDNEELIAAKKAAKENGVTVVERSVMLGEITNAFDNSICISGTHGKTTATGMLSHMLLSAGVDITAVVGGKLSAFNGNGRAGSSDIMVCEACEFKDTFLQLKPAIAVILNIDCDHMDYFKTMDNLILSFKRFIGLSSKLAIINGDNQYCKEIIADCKLPVKTFGLSSHNDYYPANITVHDGIHQSFDMYEGKEKLGRVHLYVPGEHNILNAVAAIASALAVNVGFEQCVAGIESFYGAGRRFEKLAEIDGVTIVDDYAHHPEEIRVTLQAAKSLNYNRIWAVHQPFTYSRTALLLDDFAKVLSMADKVVLTEIMGSREKNTLNIYSKDLADRIKGASWFSTFEEVAKEVSDNALPGDLVITLGCGDVYKVAKIIIKNLEERQDR